MDKRTRPAREDFEPVWEEDPVEDRTRGSSADIILYDILWDAIRLM
jgi:hypothetical protein